MRERGCEVFLLRNKDSATTLLPPPPYAATTLLLEQQLGWSGLALLVLCDARLGDVEVVCVAPCNDRLCVVGLLHVCEQAQVVEDLGYKLVRLIVAEPVAPAILDELELAVDALTERDKGQ